DETGATIAVARETYTVPVLLVDWIKKAERGLIPSGVPAIGCAILTAVSFFVILISKVFAKRGALGRIRLG
ncbi:hypothetical protein DRN86_04430, partial [Candidatus Geothermarchaeota archaeon]